MPQLFTGFDMLHALRCADGAAVRQCGESQAGRCGFLVGDDGMKIALIDADGHNFPNLPLMKLSAYHKSRGDDVSWWMPLEHYDIAYKSKVFDFTPDIDYMPLAVAEQNGTLCIWVQFDRTRERSGEFGICVDILGTGIASNAAGEYLGTVVMSYGLVWHVYAKPMSHLEYCQMREGAKR